VIRFRLGFSLFGGSDFCKPQSLYLRLESSSPSPLRARAYSLRFLSLAVRVSCTLDSVQVGRGSGWCVQVRLLFKTSHERLSVAVAFAPGFFFLYLSLLGVRMSLDFVLLAVFLPFANMARLGGARFQPVWRKCLFGPAEYCKRCVRVVSG